MVYLRRTPGPKHDQAIQWNLPDRVFFAAGACHVLAHAFLERFPEFGAKPFWIKPLDGSPTNHVIVLKDEFAFDYHGFSKAAVLLAHFRRRALRHWPDWRGEIVELNPDALVSERISKSYPGLWLREPDQFLQNALPRAHRYLNRFVPPPGWQAVTPPP